MKKMNLNSLKTGPDAYGKFGIHGGRFVAETLMPLILDVENAYEKAIKDKSFINELGALRRCKGILRSPNSFTFSSALLIATYALLLLGDRAK